MTEPVVVARALGALTRALATAGLPYAIMGGIAAIVRGIPRHTNDVDVTVMGADADVERLLGLLAAEGIEPRIEDALPFAEANQVLLLVHRPTDTPIDLSLGWLPFEEDAIRSAETVSIGGCPAPVVRPERLIIYKAVAWRDRDREDIRRLVERYDATLPWGRIEAVVAELAAAMDLPDRVEELTALRTAVRLA